MRCSVLIGTGAPLLRWTSPAARISRAASFSDSVPVAYFLRVEALIDDNSAVLEVDGAENIGLVQLFRARNAEKSVRVIELDPQL